MVIDFFIENRDSAVVRSNQAIDELNESGLAAAAGSNNGSGFVRLEREANIF